MGRSDAAPLQVLDGIAFVAVGRQRLWLGGESPRFKRMALRFGGGWHGQTSYESLTGRLVASVLAGDGRSATIHGL